MSDSTLRYVALDLDDMHEPGTCTIRRCRMPDGSVHWRLWALVIADEGPERGHVVMIGVLLNVGGGYIDGPDASRKQWGFNRTAPGQWAISPSIVVPNIWHHTPVVVGAPEPAPWA